MHQKGRRPQPAHVRTIHYTRVHFHTRMSEQVDTSASRFPSSLSSRRLPDWFYGSLVPPPPHSLHRCRCSSPVAVAALAGNRSVICFIGSHL